VHFLCKHSFHQRCLNIPTPGSVDREELENSLECPVCAKENATIKAIRRAQEDAAGRHDLFLDVLRRSKDGLGTVAEFFGRGVMGEGQDRD
jgi:hypothetical protein